MAPVTKMSREDLLAQRRQLEAAAGMTEAELRQHHRTHALTGEQWEILWALDGVAFLLGEDAE